MRTAFIRKAWQGGLGLGPTFWLGFCLGGIVLAGAFAATVQLTNSIFLGFVGLLVLFSWQLFEGVATMRAAAKFTGNAALAMTARLAVVASAVLLAHGTAKLFGIL